MRSQGRGEHAMAEQRAVAAGARTGSSAGVAKSPWRGIGRRLSWSSKILRSGLNRPTSGHRRPFPHICSAILKASQPRMAIPTPQKSMTVATASSCLLHDAYVLRRRMASNKLFVRLSGEAVELLCPSAAAGPSVVSEPTADLGGVAEPGHLNERGSRSTPSRSPRCSLGRAQLRS